MQFSRVRLAGDSGEPFEFRFAPRVTVVDLDPDTTVRVRGALEAFLQGRADGSQIYLSVDGIEIEAMPELTEQLASRLTGRNEVVMGPTTTEDKGASAHAVTATALRSALELLGAVEPTLDHGTIAAALDTIGARRRAGSADANGGALAGQVGDHVDIVSEFALRLRSTRAVPGPELGGADRQALTQALDLVLDLGFGIEPGSDAEIVGQAEAVLDQIESNGLWATLDEAGRVRTEPLPALGTVPLILDGVVAGLDTTVGERALAALDPYVGVVQVVYLSADPAVVRWANRHGAAPVPSRGDGQ